MAEDKDIDNQQEENGAEEQEEESISVEDNDGKEEDFFETASDDIDKHFNIGFDSPLKDLSSDFANAYPVQEKKFRIKDVAEQKPLYALIFDNSYPLHMTLINHLKTIDYKDPSPNTLGLIDDGVIKERGRGGESFCVIVERPNDKTLEEIFINNPVPERYLINTIILPLAQAINRFSAYGYSHGCINPRNIYFNAVQERVYIGECVSEPCGYSQLPLYEPTERALCDKLGKGNQNQSSDYYALGVLILFLMTGKKSFIETNDDDAMLEAKLAKGSYNALTEGITIPALFSELLKSLLTDKADRRWKFDQVDNWVKRKPNPSASAPAKDAMRGFLFNDKEYFTTRALAHAFFKNPDQIKKNFKISDLSRWIKNSVTKPELAQGFSALPFSNRLSDPGMSPAECAKIMALLDPEGPIRFGEVSLSIHGFGNYLAYGYAKNKREMIQDVGDIFNNGILQYWMDVIELDDDTDARYSNVKWYPRRLIKTIRNPSLGFGMERALYEINPTLPCQSPILSGRFVGSIYDLLEVLNDIAASQADKLDPVDRHIAAFIASKIDMREEVSIRKLSDFPNMARHPQIIMLAFLVAAQQYARMKDLKGLSSWIAERLLIPLGTLHAKSLRENTIEEMQSIARQGNLQGLFNYVTDPSYIKKDSFSYKEALKQYKEINEHIIFLSNEKNTERKAYQYGLRIAVSIGYMVLTGTILFMIASI